MYNIFYIIYNDNGLLSSPLSSTGATFMLIRRIAFEAISIRQCSVDAENLPKNGLAAAKVRKTTILDSWDLPHVGYQCLKLGNSCQ